MKRYLKATKTLSGYIKSSVIYKKVYQFVSVFQSNIKWPQTDSLKKHDDYEAGSEFPSKFSFLFGAFLGTKLTHKQNLQKD
jgi:hypothetical protein